MLVGEEAPVPGDDRILLALGAPIGDQDPVQNGARWIDLLDVDDQAFEVVVEDILLETDGRPAALRSRDGLRNRQHVTLELVQAVTGAGVRVSAVSNRSLSGRSGRGLGGRGLSGRGLGGAGSPRLRMPRPGSRRRWRTGGYR